MCTFKRAAVSNWELYRSFHESGSREEYIEYLAKIKSDLLIVREKEMGEEEYLKFFLALWERCGRSPKNREGSLIIPHRYLSAVYQTGCSCVHLPLSWFRTYREAEKLVGIETIGVSVHSVKEAEEAEKLGASYLTAGHVFATDCKRGLPPRGLEFLEEICNSVTVPVYAIGGIHPGNLWKIKETGAAGACMMSEYMKRECLPVFPFTFL